MKTKILTSILALAFLAAYSSDDRYGEAMAKNIHTVYTANTFEELQQAANAFNRIGSAEKSKWEPFYYESFGYVMMATRENDGVKKDGYLDLAQVAADKAMAIKADDSEILVMQGFISMIRIAVDPQARGMKYSALAAKYLDQAGQLNGENPRVLSMMAQLQLGTAKFFNSQPTAACESARKALEKFDTFKPAGPLSPVWGKEMTQGLLKNCQ